MTSDAPGTPTRSDLASSFGAVADQYDRVRPGYPDAAVDWMLPAGSRRVVDLGAGTGKLSRLLAARGLAVTAVEPDAGMRRVLAESAPDVDVRAGSGEAIPVGDGEEDAVLVAQAWHWMDAGEAAREAARVLRAGGRLGIVWNVMDTDVDWVAQLDALLQPGRRSSGRAVEPGPFPGFGPVEHASFPHAHPWRPRTWWPWPDPSAGSSRCPTTSAPASSTTSAPSSPATRTRPDATCSSCRGAPTRTGPSSAAEPAGGACRIRRPGALAWGHRRRSGHHRGAFGREPRARRRGR
ncbi:class I SAM-dependent methyltransferase [Clavibacter tessellarius]|uniref:class I SAM-dependent methyltransferase n=1 Tax=Clavibacter tessellarius TaxID=31965 RepID=UPI0032533A8F